MSESASDQIEVRRSEPGDCDAVVDIWLQLASEHVDRDPGYWGLIADEDARSSFREYFDRFIGSDEHVHVVAQVGGRVAGFIHGSVIQRPPVMAMPLIGRIDEVAVHKDFRSRGVGAKMLGAILEAFKEKGLSHVYLMVDKDNEAAISLYESAEFYCRQHHMVKKL
jgi:ribosomal protein S18 acetylase RimI-like enzyme